MNGIPYRILYNNPKYGDHVNGLALPIFICNGSYFFVTLDVYVDGVVDCWGLIPITSLQAKVDSKWITTEPLIGGRISINELGTATLKEAEWWFSKANITPIAQDLFEQLNPNNQNLFDLNKRRQTLAVEWNTAEIHVGQTRMRSRYSVYRLGETGESIAGASIPLFWSSPDGVILTWCFIYADRKISIGYETELRSIDEVRTFFDMDHIRTMVEDDEWVTVLGLGRFKLSKGYWYVEKDELWKDILNCLNVLNGQPDIVEVCYQAFLTYQQNRTDVSRETLRIAYKGVPKHHREYTQQDMDAKDNDIRHIIYGEDMDFY